VLVSLIVKNQRTEELRNVSIRDAVPYGFKLLGNHSLNWIVDIPPNGEWDYRYLLKPTVPNKNGIIIPAAIVEFRIGKEIYGVRSNQPKIVVYGPRVMLTKSTDVSETEPGGSVTVTVTAENTGSTPTRVAIYDDIPENAELISGLTAYEVFLEAQRKISFSYTIKLGSKLPVNLPPAVADAHEFLQIPPQPG